MLPGFTVNTGIWRPNYGAGAVGGGGSGNMTLISGTTYNATGLGAVASIDELGAAMDAASLPTAGFLKYTILKAPSNQTITVAYLRNGTTISQSAFSTLGNAANFTAPATSILAYANDDHDSLFMDADGKGVISRSNVNTWTGNWDKFQGTTEVITNAVLDSTVVYPGTAFTAGLNATIVTFPKTNSAVWINFSNSTYKINGFGSTSQPSNMSLLLGTTVPQNSIYTISDGVNQFIIGRWGSASAMLCTANLNTGVLTATSITFTTLLPAQANPTEEDCVGTQLFAIDGSVSFLNGGIFYHGGTRPWKDVNGSPVSTTGKTALATGGVVTQTDMDIFGSIDATDRYVWFADWGHDDGGLFNVGNDSQLGVRKTNIIHISDTYTN